MAPEIKDRSPARRPRPEKRDVALPQDSQVIIVGGGPVGLGLAIELGQRGVRCVLVERKHVPSRIPKGQSLTNRSAEHFYFWRCLQELRAARIMPAGFPLRNVTVFEEFLSPYWHCEDTGLGRGEAVKSYFFQANERLPQYCTEAVLRQRLSQIDCVQTMFGWTAGAFEQDAGGRIRVVATNEDGSDENILIADYLVGCDGARSAVRETFSIDQTRTVHGEKMVLVVFRSRELHDLLERFPAATTFRILKPGLKGAWQFFGRVDVGEEWFFHSPISQDAANQDLDVIGLMHDAAGAKFEAELMHVGFWDFQTRIADRYRSDRVIIGGDACHSHPPYGGLGLNNGLEDARNLGWKLAAVLHGWGSDRLLDSYDAERRPIFVETGSFLIADVIAKDCGFLERYHPRKNLAAFEAAWSKIPDTLERRVYEPHYEGSPIVFGPTDGKCSILGRYSSAAEPGHHLASSILSDGRNVFEALGPDFTLLAFGIGDDAVSRFASAARALRVPMETVRDSFDDARLAYGHRAVLVRPDHYVAWAAHGLPDDPAKVLLKATGRLGPIDSA